MYRRKAALRDLLEQIDREADTCVRMARPGERYSRGRAFRLENLLKRLRDFRPLDRSTRRRGEQLHRRFFGEECADCDFLTCDSLDERIREAFQLPKYDPVSGGVKRDLERIAESVRAPFVAVGGAVMTLCAIVKEMRRKP